MEINQIYNTQLKEQLGNAAIATLIDDEIIDENEISGLGIRFGYIFTTDDNELEALYTVKCAGKTFYFSVRRDAIMIEDIDEDMFEKTVTEMKSCHPCIMSNELSETDVQKARHENNNKLLSENDIAVSQTLTCLYNDEDVRIKSIDEAADRAIACLLCVQIACDIANDDYEESVKFFRPLFEKYEVQNCLNSKEKRILDGSYTVQDAIDMDWAYESYWALCWCMGLVDDISDGSVICDCEKAVSFLMDSSTKTEFKSKCRLRSKEEILDMQDLYYRYQWAINDSKVNETSSSGDLDPSIVIERRRALEWMLRDVDDWYDISLDA